MITEEFEERIKNKKSKSITKKSLDYTLEPKLEPKPKSRSKTETKIDIDKTVSNDSTFVFRDPSADPVIHGLVEDIVKFLEDKKLTQIKVINLGTVNPYFCFFMIATANSEVQLGTVAREISARFQTQLLDKKVRPIDVESGWVIRDFVDVVLHLFLEEKRQYYNLEKLWGDAPVIYSEEQPKFQWPLLHKTKAE